MKRTTITLDEESIKILKYFKGKGSNISTTIRMALREFMEGELLPEAHLNKDYSLKIKQNETSVS